MIGTLEQAIIDKLSRIPGVAACDRYRVFTPHTLKDY